MLRCSLWSAMRVLGYAAIKTATGGEGGEGGLEHGVCERQPCPCDRA